MTLKDIVRNTIIQSLRDQGKAIFYAEISKQFKITPQGALVSMFNSGQNLRVRSGKLLQSFFPNSSRLIYNINATEDKVMLEYGIKTDDLPYAWIHEVGGEIPVTPKARRYFFYKFKETGNDEWFYMFISQKPSFIMPSRPYFGPGVQGASEKLKQMMTETLLKAFEQVIKEFKG